MSELTTLTLEDDIAARLQEEARLKDGPSRRSSNDALRAGLELRDDDVSQYQVHARDMGIRRGVDLDDTQGLLARLDGPDRR